MSKWKQVSVNVFRGLDQDRIEACGSGGRQISPLASLIFQAASPPTSLGKTDFVFVPDRDLGFEEYAEKYSIEDRDQAAAREGLRLCGLQEIFALVEQCLFDIVPDGEVVNIAMAPVANPAGGTDILMISFSRTKKNRIEVGAYRVPDDILYPPGRITWLFARVVP